MFVAASWMFPSVDTPAGWTRESKGPRFWLVPPEGDARIVLPPLQARLRHQSPPLFLEHILAMEADRFPRRDDARPEVVTSRQHYPGLVIDISSPVLNEQRCYTLYSTKKVIAVMFLQARPARFAELRSIFLDVAAGVVLPEAEVPPPHKLEPWDEL